MDDLHCEKSIDLNSVTLISKREDLKVFTKKIIGDSFELKKEDKISEIFILASAFVFLDVTLLKEEDVTKYSGLLSTNSGKIIYIDSYYTDEKMTELLSGYVKNRFYYPENEGDASNVFWKLVSKSIGSQGYKKSFDIGVDETYFEGLLGNSKQMNQIKKQIVSCAKSELPVLILGETGTGKSTIARIIHNISCRNKKPYVHVNIANVDDALAESELFGAERGAYTDALKRMGKFKAADGGTLFLDEIGCASKSIQGKLLTVLDNGEFYSVGSDVVQKADVRLICATNADLTLKVMQGEFRRDLYYRIRGQVIYIPGLRERVKDIRPIAEGIAKRYGKVLTEASFRNLENYSWPGNVRELEYCIRRACVSENREINIQEIEFDV